MEVKYDERNRLERVAVSWVHTDITKAISLKGLEALRSQLKQLQTLGLSRKIKLPVVVLGLDGIFQRRGL